MFGCYTPQSIIGRTVGQAVLRRFFWSALALAFVGALAPLAVGAGAKGPQAATPAMVQAQVRKFGVGKDVKVTLAGGQKLRGHITAIGENSFTISQRKDKTEREISYHEVAVIKDPGPLVWILIGAAIAVIIIVAVHH